MHLKEESSILDFKDYLEWGKAFVFQWVQGCQLGGMCCGARFGTGSRVCDSTGSKSCVCAQQWECRIWGGNVFLICESPAEGTGILGPSLWWLCMLNTGKQSWNELLWSRVSSWAWENTQSWPDPGSKSVPQMHYLKLFSNFCLLHFSSPEPIFRMKKEDWGPKSWDKGVWEFILYGTRKWTWCGL